MAFTFGAATPSSQAAAPGFSFGAPAAATTAASTGFSFGAPAASTAASTGFSFGAPAASQPSTGLFGAPAASTPASTGFSFGTPAASQASTGLFGAPTASTPASTGFSFGSTATSQPSTGLFGAAPATSQPAAGFSFGGTAATTQPSTGLFGATPAASQPSGGLFGATPAASQPSGGLFGATPAASQPSGGLFGAASTAAPSLTLTSAASTAPSLGLGGPAPAGLGGAAAEQGKAAGKPPRETDVPPEVLETLKAFQQHVAQQKAECEHVSHHSWAPVKRVGEETAALARLLAAVEGSVQRHAAAAARLKQDVCEALKRAEVAQRTAEISAGLQHENTAPQELFERLVQQYEAAMVTYRRQIDQLEWLLAAADGAGVVSPQDLMRAIRQLHETFVWLAGHLHTVHERVQALKDQYVAYRRTVMGDTGDVFSGARSRPPPPPAAARPQPGPSPFAVDRNAAAAAVARAMGQPPPAATPAPAPAPAGAGLFSGGSSFGFSSNTTTLFGSSGTGFGGSAAGFGGNTGFGAVAAANPFGTATPSTGFKLDPAPGSKRGKAN